MIRLARSLILTLAFAAAAAIVQPSPALAQNDPITNKPVQESSVLDYVNAGYQFMAVIGGLLAVLMLIYAGYRYMTSYGDPEHIKDAKDIVEKALIGLALLILAALILNTINPRTSQNPCNPGEPGCGSVDFSEPDGGAQQNQVRSNQSGGQSNNQGAAPGIQGPVGPGGNR